MNKKIMSLALLIGLGFSQVPVQASFFDGLALPKVNPFAGMGDYLLVKVLKNHPVLTLAALGGVACGLACLRYKILSTDVKDSGHDEELIYNIDDRGDVDIVTL